MCEQYHNGKLAFGSSACVWAFSREQARGDHSQLCNSAVDQRQLSPQVAVAKSYIRSMVTAITIGAVRSGPLTSSMVSITSCFFGVTIMRRICWPPSA